MRLKQKVHRPPRKHPIRVSPPPPAPEPSASAPRRSSRRAKLHSRSRIGAGHTILPPPDSALHGNLTFTRDSERARYDNLCSKPIIPCKYVHFPTLETLRIYREVTKLIDGIGWHAYFDIRCPAFIELVREFYATFVFDKPADFTLHSPNVIRFRLMGQRFTFSVTEFNIAFGFETAASACSEDYLNSRCDFSADFEPVSLYRSWTQNSSLRYNPSTSKDTYIVDAALKYVHRFLAFSFSGRKDSASVLSKAEFFFLWCMSCRIKVNLGCWLATQFASVAVNKRPLILGSLITHLAVNLNLLSLDTHDLHLACEMQPLDMTCLLGMGLVGQHNGEFHFCPPGPLVPRRARVVHDRGTTSSDSSSPSSSSDEDTARSTTARLRRLERRLSRMEKNLTAYFHHVGFTPPAPPTP